MYNTTLCYITRGDEVLMLHRVKKKNDINKDKWIGIGGKFLPDETPQACVLREAFEETGLTIENPRLCGVKEWENQDGSRYIVMLYKTNNFSGKLHDSAEGPVFWATREEILSMQMTEHFDKMMEIFFREDLSEFYYQKTTNRYTIQML